MPRVSRVALATLAGFVVVVVASFLIDQAGLWLYPLPAGMTMENTSMANVMASRPPAALLFNVLLRPPMTVLSAFVAVRLSRGSSASPGFAVGILFLLFALGPAFIVHFPLWVIVASIVIIPACGLLGGRLGLRRN